MADRHAGGEDSDDRRQTLAHTVMKESDSCDIMQTIKHGLKELWATGCLSDVTLKADGREFQAHRAVLAAASPFFMAMFSGVWAETRNQKPIEMKGVTAVGLQGVLTFIYTGTVALEQCNILQVMMAADHLQVRPAVNFCAEYLVDTEIPIENCVDVLNFANLNNICELKRAAFYRAADNFEQILQAKYHLDLDLEDLETFLGGDKQGEDVIQFGSEILLFYGVVEWLRYDEENRMKHLEKLMKVIRFPLMSAAEIGSIIQDYSFMTEIDTCKKIITDFQQYHEKPVYERTLDDSKNTVVRSRESVLLTGPLMSTKIEAFTLSSSSGILENPVERKWTPLKDFPGVGIELDVCKGKLCTVSVNGFLVVLVKEELTDHSTDTEVVAKLSPWVFDPRSFDWSTLASHKLKDDHSLHTAVALGDELFVFMNHKDSSFYRDRVAVILIYSFKTNTWSSMEKGFPKLCKYSVCVQDQSLHVFSADGRTIVPNIYIPEIEQYGRSKWVRCSLCYHGGHDRSESYALDEEVLYIGVGEELSLMCYGHTEWYIVMHDGKLPRPSAESVRVVCGGNLFFLANKAVEQYTTELTLGCCRYNDGRNRVIKHQGLPLDLKRGCLAVAIRIPQNRYDSM